MSNPALQYDLYRCTAHGGSKDWGITITGSGDIETLHCATGHTVKRTHIPRSQFNSAPSEQDRRIREKEAKGYVHLGKATVDSNRFKLLQGSSAPPVAADHWEIVQPLDRQQLHDKLAWVARQLTGHVAPDTIEYDPDNVVIRCSGPQKWIFGFTDEGGVHNTGRGGGQIVRRQGLLPRLIIVYLMKSFPEAIRLSDGDEERRPRIVRDDDFLGEGAFDYERVLALGERLGLCLGRIDFDSPSTHRAIWF